jgi:eukaryotic-like serine/threonine-protein kinase
MAQELKSAATDDSTPPDWKGTARYEILNCIGRGGMGVVYEAFDRERRQLVALKTLLHFDAATLYLFKQEFRTLADVQHANLVHLHELEVTETGQVFFTMELVRGQDFRAYATRPDTHRSSSSSPTAGAVPRGDRETLRPGRPGAAAVVQPFLGRSPADIDRLRPVLRQLVEGVHALHCAGKLHRDIKPSNVIVTVEGRVVLLDFGVATELRGGDRNGYVGAGEVVGTARYMAPEQADDLPPSPASDWYSVGIMLYEILAGRPPFSGSLTEILTLKTSVDPLAPSMLVDGVPPDLDALCMALLERPPEKRPAGSELLRRLGAKQNSSAPPPYLGAPGAHAAFIGRKSQLAALREAFELARSGRGVAVHVHGAPGTGKSTMVTYFVDELAQDGLALVLRGRAYEREAVPYKAIDSLIDALYRHLARLDDAGDPLPMPKDAWAIAKIFPVLQRVPGVGPAPERTSDDPQALRRRAFGALRTLLASLAERQPVVLLIDDAQWGDVDSAALLLDVLGAPMAPRIFLLLAYRDGEAEDSPCLAAMRSGWTDAAAVRDVEVGALALEDAQLLATVLLGAEDEASRRTARAVARESRGSPFLIEELVRANRGVMSSSGATLAVLTLDQLVGLRLAKLTGPARQLAELVAVGGRPLPVSVVAAASGIREVNETVALLAAWHFARTGLRNGRDVVEASHGRIAETIVALLPAVTLSAHHGRLARALEEADGEDAEAIAMHWLGAGENQRAAVFASTAAEKAASKLAFDRAARLFRLTLEHTAASSPDVRRLQRRLAESLRLAGSHEESARMYLAAADGASPEEHLALQQAAADQLLSAGRTEEGTRTLHHVLAAVGMRAPRSRLATVFWLLVYKVWLAVLGLKFKERSPADATPEDRLRLEALFTVTHGFAIVDVILSACMQARHLIEALRTGDRFQLLRAVAVEIGHQMATGRPVKRRERALVELGQGLAERHGTEEGRAVFEAAWGIGLFQRGHWNESRVLMERAVSRVPYGYSGMVQARLFAVYAYTFTGEIKETARRTAQLCAEASHRGDLFTTVNLRTSIEVRSRLAADDPEGARHVSREALARWAPTGFFVQNWQAMVYEPDIDIYVGDGAAAYDRFERDLRTLEKSFLLHSGFIRAMTCYARGRVAIASIGARPEQRRARIVEARRMVRELERECDPWTHVLSSVVKATADNAAGDRSAAIASLRTLIHRAEETDSLIFVPPARHRLGQLLGGEEGREQLSQAARTMAAQEIRAHERWVNTFLPGNWPASDAT